MLLFLNNILCNVNLQLQRTAKLLYCGIARLWRDITYFAKRFDPIILISLVRGHEIQCSVLADKARPIK